MKVRYTLSRSLVIDRSWPFFLDLTVAMGLLAGFYAVLQIARYWLSGPVPEVVISQSPRMLPLYAFYSVVRIGVAYLLSLLFAVGYGYVAAYHRRVETLMIATLDILQSIPVLSFLPGVMLAMMSLIPSRQLGIEFGAILLIFTGQVWNMAFSFYTSLKSIPRELHEACTINRFSRWQRFWQLELPYSTIGLVWNSMVSVAGGWFFLMVCEMFPVGNRNFRLPGLGSYLQTAASTGNSLAMIYGLSTMIAIIVLTDQLIWRPIIDWSDKFKFENVEAAERVTSPVLAALRQSNVLGILHQRTFAPFSEYIYHLISRRQQRHEAEDKVEKSKMSSTVIAVIFAVLIAGLICFAAFKAILLLRHIPGSDFGNLLAGAGATFFRVNVSLLFAAAWTIPAGVAIGFNPKLARIAQPLAQIAASFPATALFPVILLALMKLGAGLGIGSIVLMMLGTQWYILFNVIAGAMAIPSDLREVARLFHFTSMQRWTTVILPGIFPFLITGLVTASGGAWNASIIAEYFHLKDQTLHTLGLGAQISAASDSGNFPVLLLATIIMALMVVTINRLVWRPLYKLAETKYRLEG
ncbi:ABC transporter permease subunit [Acidobacterium sp. S8]|uniref:ABC transporter permease n=1 Tax=Acidobacterium sp. S8 TaxID=1641854 RepID=UPI00131C1B81|nr:ABC transporter permease subunit [Acidobacterium sp. S8]